MFGKIFRGYLHANSIRENEVLENICHMFMVREMKAINDRKTREWVVGICLHQQPKTQMNGVTAMNSNGHA